MGNTVIIVVSGGMDPVHSGHLRMLKAARAIGGYVVVILNSDEWLTRKKGAPFMSYEERKEILKGFDCVDEVVAQINGHSPLIPDDTVVGNLRELRNRFTSQHDILMFANGGDRVAGNTPEVAFCMENGIPVLFGLGGKKIQSSSQLVEQAKCPRTSTPAETAGT